MKKRFIFVYFMKKDSDNIPEIIPLHVQYWKNLNLPKYFGGPFADRSGGLISFEAVSAEKAAQIVSNDPFLLENLIENKWLKEWIAD